MGGAVTLLNPAAAINAARSHPLGSNQRARSCEKMRHSPMALWHGGAPPTGCRARCQTCTRGVRQGEFLTLLPIKLFLH